ncbi:nidogen [Cylas formicarius]|uniref:nidogen n=1 Tax=Cylas formicarius TaxID=197179 RepID=UPI002958AC89|nr:nidogen [Cylas formicarius]
MKIKIWCAIFSVFAGVSCIPVDLLYEVAPGALYLPQSNDISSEEIKLKVPVLFYGDRFDTVFVNSNGFLSFQTEIPHFINIEFPLDYAIIAPFYANVDTSKSGTISYYETESANVLERATESVHEAFVDSADFQATSVFVVTWKDVGYYREGSDKLNTYQVAIITNGIETYAEFLYPENGIQWIQGIGDDSGLPDARAQVGFLSVNGKMFTLPGSGTEQVRALEKWTNMGLPGQFIYKIDGPEILEPDFNNEGSQSSSPRSCAEAPAACHSQARCIDFDEGFCCECNQRYYGDGKYCVKANAPLRVMGKVNGVINGERLNNLDLQSYIVTNEGRAYTAISKIPESVGSDVQTLQILGGVIGYLFAKPTGGAQNGFQITGGHFNHTASLKFINTNQELTVKQKFSGLDVFDQLRVDVDVHGELPSLPPDSRVVVDEYREQYTRTGPGLIQTASDRVFQFSGPGGETNVNTFRVEQTFKFDHCPYKNVSVGETWNLNVDRNFISYESREQIIRFGLSNDVIPAGGFDPCEEGKHKCGENSNCVVESDRYRCVCNPGYQHILSGDANLCVDINECQNGVHECDLNAQCVNTIGSYSCVCNPGYEGSGFECQHVKTCADVACADNAECVQYADFAGCRCIAGFKGDGNVCRPVTNQGCHVNNNCSPYGICSIDRTTQRYSCSCQPGYEGDGYFCRLQPQYESTVVPDTTMATSIPQIGDADKVTQQCFLGVCWCPERYAKEAGTDKCVPDVGGTVTTTPGCDASNNCHADAQCVYVQNLETYACACNEGFEGDGYTCVPEVVSCTKTDNCDSRATCAYDETLGRSKCVCNPGYTGDGYVCNAIASCASNDDCAPTETCAFTGSHEECVCREGHVRDSQHVCVPLMTSSCGGGYCVENAECLFDDEYQTFYCTCKTGYVGDGITECKLKPVGCDVLNNCGLHAVCQYDEQAFTYVCRCNPGFFGNGTNCFVEKNCLVDPAMCDPRASCVTNADRRYFCQCPSGYVGNGSVCKEVVRQEGNFLLLNQGMATLKIPMEPTRRDPGKPIQIKLFQTAVGLDIDCTEGRVYWSDISGRAIRSATYNGSDKADFVVNSIGSPEGLAVDWVSRNIYWTDSTLDTVEVANLDSKRRRTLFKTDLVNPRGIAVHPQRGKIFWSDWDRTRPKIEWANADGTDRRIFLEAPFVSLPNSLTVDYETEQLCFADAGTKKIECVQIDTKQTQTIAVNCTYPFGIAVTDREVYWSDWISKKIERVDKYNLKRLPSLTVPLGGSGNKLFGLVAVPNSCPRQANVCEYSRCSEERICLPNGSGSRSCLCSYRVDAPEEEPTTCTL